MLTEFDAATRRRVLSAKTIGNVVQILAHRLYEDGEDGGFDCDPDIAGLPDGPSLNLRTGETRKTEKEDRLTMALGHSPQSGECPRFERYLAEAIPDESARGYVLQWLGYALTGRTESEAFLFVHGLPGSGKSTLARLMLHLMGDYGWTVAGEHVAGWKETHRQWLAKLAGKRFVAVTELPKAGGTWRTADLNSLITGEPMEANLMRQNSHQFTPVSVSGQGPGSSSGCSIVGRT